MQARSVTCVGLLLHATLDLLPEEEFDACTSKTPLNRMRFVLMNSHSSLEDSPWKDLLLLGSWISQSLPEVICTTAGTALMLANTQRVGQVDSTMIILWNLSRMEHPTSLSNGLEGIWLANPLDE
jgi:hypothetical protein